MDLDSQGAGPGNGRPSLPSRPVPGQSPFDRNSPSPQFVRSVNEFGMYPAALERQTFSPSLSSIGAAGYQDPGNDGLHQRLENPYSSDRNGFIGFGGNTAGSVWPLISDEINLRGARR